MIGLSTADKNRFKRNVMLEGIGEQGQLKLNAAKVLIIGLGGLGSPAAMYLAAAGVGTLGLCDSDTVDASNLQRQIIHSENTIQTPKTESAAHRLQTLYPSISIRQYSFRADTSNLPEIVKKFDFVIEATDTFQAKFLVNDVCVNTAKPFSHGGVMEYSGQSMTVIPGQSACYRCVFRSPPTNVPLPSSQGILGPVAGIIGCIQATEAIKFVTGVGEMLTNSLLTFDALRMVAKTIPFSVVKKCERCIELE